MPSKRNPTSYRTGGTRGGRDQFKWEDVKSDKVGPAVRDVIQLYVVYTFISLCAYCRTAKTIWETR
jgi:hypothetical protein